MQNLPKLLDVADLAEIFGISEEAISMRLSREPKSFPPRWSQPGTPRRKARQERLWHPQDVADWLEAGRAGAKK